MADIIQLLPESIANQIAAGEVIQRPASVVKELLENAIDAGSDHIELILKDSGKTLIQVVDNGKGMSETDARMSFERHATSKIKSADDLFAISTMGFRGEALASIASIAHVDLKTRTAQHEMGTHIRINGSKVEFQEVCQTPVGTSLSIKNLFFNVPARRKFLKSDPVELRHILEEFKRVAIIHPEISFKVYHDQNELYVLPGGNFRQRIVSIFGKKINEQLVPVQEETDDLVIQGFVGQAESAKKSRSEQYLFVNQRFIKSNYITHAVKLAYGELIPKDYYPLYILNISIDPSRIDINVHPTKHEIKFEEERLIYNFVNVAVRHALGRYKLTPMIDFGSSDAQFRERSSRNPAPVSRGPSTSEVKEWNEFYENLSPVDQGSHNREISLQSSISDEKSVETIAGSGVIHKAVQIHQSYILHHIKSGFILIDQKAAHERILYERYLNQLDDQQSGSQKMLFPLTFKYSAEKHLLIMDLNDKLTKLGFEIEDFGHQSIVVHGIPVGMEEKSVEAIIDGFISAFQENLEFKLDLNDNLAKSLAQHSSIKRGKYLSDEEMKNLIDQLFACEMPYTNPSGQKCILSFSMNDLQKMFAS